MALFPLKITNMKSMRKMQALKPQIDDQRQVQGRKHDAIRATEQKQEVMDLYKKHGVNPMGGCVPMLVQIPFFFAFYKVLPCLGRNARRQLAVGPDLSQPERFGIHILPIIMIVSQF